jgi:hypothetical protein
VGHTGIAVGSAFYDLAWFATVRATPRNRPCDALLTVGVTRGGSAHSGSSRGLLETRAAREANGAEVSVDPSVRPIRALVSDMCKGGTHRPCLAASTSTCRRGGMITNTEYCSPPHIALPRCGARSSQFPSLVLCYHQSTLPHGDSPCKKELEPRQSLSGSVTVQDELLAVSDLPKQQL